MQDRKYIFGLSSVTLVIILGAAVKFAIHMYYAPGYGFFGDELYTIALSRHLAFGYVDLPPLVPALVALSRLLLGGSLFALHIVPALAGAATLVFICLIAKEFGGKWFAVALSALGFIIVPLWLMVDSIFCYDSIDQMILAGFLFTMVRFLRTGDRRLWILLGLIAGIACMTKMTILFLGPGFLVALLVSKYRKDLLTPWPWLGGALCLIIVTPYILWQFANHWPTLEYWTHYGSERMYHASIKQYLINILIYMNPFLLPFYAAGLYRIFRRLGGVNYGFLGVLFLFSLVLMYVLRTSARMLVELFIPLLAASAVFVEEKLAGLRWEKAGQAVAALYLLSMAFFALPLSLPILPADRMPSFADRFRMFYQPLREFNVAWSYPPLLTGRLGWDELVREVAGVYDELPAEERAIAGIYADWYMPAGAIDLLGPQYGLPHAVSGFLTYYLWGPGYSWDVMILVTSKSNNMSVFFDQCELKAVGQHVYDAPVGRPYIYVCRKPKVPADVIWSSVKSYR
jgi:4-amino-4-deoxy-L-arabinose transferase-like glycosyltransferase